MSNPDPHAHARASDAHVREAELLGDLPDVLIRGFADQWAQAEARIKVQNDTKAAMVAKVRAVHGKVAADALKMAARMALSDPEKRVRADQTNAIARRFLRVIEGTAFKSRFDQ